MPHFFFRDRHNTVRTIISRDLAQAAVEASKSMPDGWRLAAGRPRVSVSLTERMWLWRQLAALLADGAPLAAALARLSEAAATGPARVAAARLADLCAQGASLADALAAVPGVADDEHIAFIAAAERSGRLPQAVAALAELVETDADTAAELAIRWIYPSAVAIFGLVVLPLFTLFARRALPNFSRELWEEFGLKPSDVGYADVLWQGLTNVPMALLIVAAALFIFVLLSRRATWRWRRSVDRLLYLFPGYGAFRFHRRLAIFFRALALGADAGLPDSETLALARATLGPVLSTQLIPAQSATDSGQPVARALSSLAWLPETVRSRLLAATPESFSSIAEALAAEHRRLADYYARRFVTIAEPAMVVIVALAVGAVAVATFGPAVRLITIVTQLSQ